MLAGAGRDLASSVNLGPCCNEPVHHPGMARRLRLEEGCATVLPRESSRPYGNGGETAHHVVRP